MKKIFLKLDAGSFLWNVITKTHFSLRRHTISFTKNNKKIKDKYKNQRCFVIGNGPSLIGFDSKLLKDEYCITVNSIAESPLFSDIDPIYHLFVDRCFFKVGDLFDSQLTKLASKKNVVLCLPAEFKSYYEKRKDKYGINSIYFNSFFYYRKIKKIDFSTCIPGFNKVIHYAICLAIYLGFSEIYLLGCDETGIETTLNLLLDGATKNDHCYDDSEDTKKAWLDELKNYGVEWFFDDQAIVFRNYRKIADYCKNNSIGLFNLSPRSLIDSIERKTVDQIKWKV